MAMVRLVIELGLLHATRKDRYEQGYWPLIFFRTLPSLSLIQLSSNFGPSQMQPSFEGAIASRSLSKPLSRKSLSDATGKLSPLRGDVKAGLTIQGVQLRESVTLVAHILYCPRSAVDFLSVGAVLGVAALALQ